MRARNQQEIMTYGKGALGVLACGEDEGSLIETLKSLFPENTERFDADVVSANPTRAIAAMCDGDLFGAGGAIIIRGAGAKHEKTIMALVERARTHGGRIGVEGPGLALTVKLAKAFDSAKDLVLAPHYLLKDKEKTTALTMAVKEEGLDMQAVITPEIESRLPGSRSEIAQIARTLVSSAIGAGRSNVTDNDLVVVGISGEIPATAPIDRALEKKPKEAIAALRTRLGDKEGPIAVIRVMTWRVGQILALHDSGLNPSAAVAAARPPVFWTDKRMVEGFLKKNTKEDVIRAMKILRTTEEQIISGGLSDISGTLLERALMKISGVKH